MPHTNRARRADHYRSIDGSAHSNDNSNRKTFNGGNTSRQRSSGEHLQDNNSGIPEDSDEFTGQGRGRTGADGRENQGRLGRGSGKSSGRNAEEAGAVKSRKSKAPSVKNRIRSLTRLMNKPVRARYLEQSAVI